ncbi:MAG: cation diffusion facilitator family transporter [bacterium]|jgi:cation diffusion facilitator family transporter|nr:cation diffusion facilitator family transporter [bacterium]
MSADRRHLKRYAWLSIAAAVATILIKGVAWKLTGSVGLLSDALESLVNLAGGIFALIMLGVAALPPDEHHDYGHSKAEYFASGVEGLLITGAALAIGWAAVLRLLAPRDLELVGAGLLVSAVAMGINLAVARVLLKAGRVHRSITLEADGKHLMTDVWTSVGVIVGVGAVALTGWRVLDPLLALAVAANILWTGYKLLHGAILGLMDGVIPTEERERILEVLARYEAKGFQFHALLTRQAAGRRFISVHVLVPGHWTVCRGHELVEEIEAEIRAVLTGSTVFTHLEPLDEPASFQDQYLDR